MLYWNGNSFFQIMSTLEVPQSHPFAWFDTFDTKENPTLVRAKNTLRKLAEIIRKDWFLNEPMIVGLQWKPWLGKSHLIQAFEAAIQWVSGIESHRPDKKYWFTQHQTLYRKANVIISDDLFQELSNLDLAFTGSFEQTYTTKALPEFLFDLYDGKKIWIVSSNFDIKEILQRISEMDWQDRLKSRIKHLLASTGTLHLEGEDHRAVLAQTGTRYSELFK